MDIDVDVDVDIDRYFGCSVAYIFFITWLVFGPLSYYHEAEKVCTFWPRGR